MAMTLANTGSMHPKLNGVLCLSKFRQMVGTQGHEHSLLRPGDRQAHLKAAGGKFRSCPRGKNTEISGKQFGRRTFDPQE